MKSVLFFSVLFLAATHFSCSAQTENHNASGLEWHTELGKARAISDATKKPIFGFFTGSDWCGWCIRLQNNVFAKPAFVEWAKKNVVLLELDFPRRKQLPSDLAQQNMNLQQAFQVSGYPTIWLFYASPDATGQRINLNALGSLGYPSGAEPGKEEVKFLETANAILASGVKK